MTIHVVQAGETVGSIAESYGVDPARLAADNAVPPSGALAVGQTLVVRFPRQVHAVRAGETLASIAEAYGTTVRRLWQNNWPLGGGAALQPGQVLVISYFDEPLGAAAFNGYAYPYIDMSLLDAELPYLTYLTPFTYGITADGDLLQLEDDALLSAARQRGVRPVMHLSTMTETGQFDTQRATLVLTDSAVQDRLVDQVQQTLRRRGYAGLDVDFEFLPGQLAAAYAPFGNGGTYNAPHLIRRITDASGRVLYQNRDSGSRVLKATSAYLMTSLLQTVTASGTGAKLSGAGTPVAGKTGTVNMTGGGNRDIWMACYNSEISCAFWMGFD